MNRLKLALLLTLWPALASAAPDLYIAELSLKPELPAIGQVVEATAVIGNQGDSAVSDFLCIGGDISVAFYVDGEWVGTEELSCGLDVGETDPESLSFYVPTGGLHMVEVVVDPDNDEGDLNLNNNAAAITFDAQQPTLDVLPKLPAIGAPGVKDVIAGVTVINTSGAKLQDVYLWLEIEGETGPLVFSKFSQGQNLSAGESATWETTLNYGFDISYGGWEPGEYTWKIQVFVGGLPPSDSAVALTAPLYSTLEVVETVAVTPDNILVPTVDPIVEPLGKHSSFVAHDVLIDNELYSVALGFAVPVDFFADSWSEVLSNIHALQVTDASGVVRCDPELRRRAAQGVLLWRDLAVYHPWYKGTYVALQESYDWYQDEKHLKVIYFITQPFVIVKEFVDDMLKQGKELGEWVMTETGLSDADEGEVGTLTFRMAMIVTKGFETAGQATQTLVKLSPLFVAQPYVDDHIISERLLQAIQDGGDDFEAAVDLFHQLIKQDSPDRYEKLSQALPPTLLIGAIGSALGEVVQQALLTAVKRGATAYFLSKLTAKTAWKIALGEGKAALMSSLTTAGIAKGIASFGVTLLIDASIAYFTYVGTFVDNVRGSGGLIEAGQVVAQSLSWSHTVYGPEGGQPLDVDDIDDTFLAHAAMFEVYGFILNDLAMIKKLALAKSQSQDYLDESAAMFDITKTQRTTVVTLQSVAQMLAQGPCEGVPAETPPEPEAVPRHEASPVADDEPTPTPPKGDPASPWLKPDRAPFVGEDGHAPVAWVEHATEWSDPPEIPAPPTIERSTCAFCPGAPDSDLPLGLTLGLLAALALLRTRRAVR